MIISLDCISVYIAFDIKVVTVIITSKFHLKNQFMQPIIFFPVFGQGEDKTIFFMTIGKTYEPIGYLDTPSSVTKIQWSPSKFVSIMQIAIILISYTVKQSIEDN